MSGDLLREAAALMRSRARAATAGPWWEDVSVSSPDVAVVMGAGYRRAELPADFSDARPFADAEHIASWHPAVALAVADWLEAVADEDWCCDGCKYAVENENPGPMGALAVARAYLGRDA